MIAEATKNFYNQEVFMALQFDSLNKVTLTEQVMQQLASKIISGELAPGEKLPPERDLCEMLQVSRSRIREALRALALIGFVVIKPSGGTFVGNRVDQMPEETIIWLFRQKVSNYSEIYEARRVVEMAVYESCFRNITLDILNGMRTNMSLLAQSNTEECNPEQFNQLLENCDMYVAKNCGNEVLYKLMQTIILLRRETSLKICEIPFNRASSVEKRIHVLHAFECYDAKEVHKALVSFFAESVRDFTFKK